MSFAKMARLPVARRHWRPLAAALIVLFVACGLLSCGKGKVPNLGTGNNAYVTIPNQGSVLMLHIDGATGAIAIQGSTPRLVGVSPYGLVLSPSKKLLYTANSLSNDISTFKINSDGTLSLIATTPDGGSTPHEAVIDPSGKYLLVTNSGGTFDVSVFSIDASSGALTAVAGSPFYANAGPDEILFAPSGNFVYVSNPGSGMVTAFTFDTSSGTLTRVPGSPFFSGAGASGLAIYSAGGSQYLYVANSSAVNRGSNTIGNISGFVINPTTGALNTIEGSPFFPDVGELPSALVLDPGGRFLFATTPGSSFSIWCFDLNPTNGQLTVANESPFSESAGGLFALIDTSGNYFYIGSAESHGVAAYPYDSITGQPKTVLDSPFSTGDEPGRMVIVH